MRGRPFGPQHATAIHRCEGRRLERSPMHLSSRESGWPAAAGRGILAMSRLRFSQSAELVAKSLKPCKCDFSLCYEAIELYAQRSDLRFDFLEGAPSPLDGFREVVDPLLDVLELACDPPNF